MSLAETWTATAHALAPYKGAIGTSAGILAATIGAIMGVLKQRRRPDTTFTEAPAPASPRGSIMRLHQSDRDVVTEIREEVFDAGRELRSNRKAIERTGEALDDLKGAVADVLREIRANGKAVERHGSLADDSASLLARLAKKHGVT